MPQFATAQEEFWAGRFGDEYTGRNQSAGLVAANIALFSKILERTPPVTSVVEFGANVGLNLRAIQALVPAVKLAAVEINSTAAEALRGLGFVDVQEGSFLDYSPVLTYDLSFTKGVLIHIDPESLPSVYDVLYAASHRYIAIAEYFSPQPQSLEYRGHSERLYKRDFAGEILDRFPDLRVVDYGFVWRRDAFPQDDLTWFLLEKPLAP